MTDPGATRYKLKRTRQCKKCPWKVSTNPHDIPNGYSEELHRKLKGSIAEPGELKKFSEMLVVMACHMSPIGRETHCVGWLMHQLGPGNNIPLRLTMRFCDNLDQLRLDGPQHDHFEETLP